MTKNVVKAIKVYIGESDYFLHFFLVKATKIFLFASPYFAVAILTFLPFQYLTLLAEPSAAVIYSVRTALASRPSYCGAATRRRIEYAHLRSKKSLCDQGRHLEEHDKCRDALATLMNWWSCGKKSIA